MKERGEAKLNDLEKVKTLRRIEIEERKVCGSNSRLLLLLMLYCTHTHTHTG